MNEDFEDVRVMEYDRWDGTLQESGDKDSDYAFVWYSEYLKLLEAYKELKYRMEGLEK